jgi:amidase
VDGVSDGADGMKVGVITEAFEPDKIDTGVGDTIAAQLDDLEDAGIEIKEVSIEAHGVGAALINAVVPVATRDGVLRGGLSDAAAGWKWGRLSRAFDIARKGQADRLSATVKLLLLLGQFLIEETGHEYYTKAKNLMLTAHEQYEAALNSCDVLALPTAPMTAYEVSNTSDRGELVARDGEVMIHTAPFNHTGHPALSVPCGDVDGLPVGLQLVGPKYGEASLYRLASAVEQADTGIEFDN